MGIYCSDAALYEEREQLSKGDHPKELDEDAAVLSQEGILQIIEGQIELISGTGSSPFVAEGCAGRKRVRGGPTMQQAGPKNERKNVIYRFNMVKMEETIPLQEMEREPPIGCEFQPPTKEDMARGNLHLSIYAI